MPPQPARIKQRLSRGNAGKRMKAPGIGRGWNFEGLPANFSLPQSGAQERWMGDEIDTPSHTRQEKVYECDDAGFVREL